MLSHYKERLAHWTDPVARALLALRLRPNHLTVLGLGVSLLAAVSFARGRERWGAVLLIVAGLFDFFDGSLARLSGQVTPFGAFLDSVIDRYSDLVVLAGVVFLFWGRPQEVVLTLVALIGTVMVSYTKARAQAIGVACEIGLMERPERLIVLIAGGLFDLMTLALLVLAVLVNLTAIQRILHTRRVARQQPGARRQPVA
ncbi:MAG: CDP-alcohol phosphatidyltransferase family protein [Candidatus Rokubacteria bacterium]|nr:CDP-alcohol phosphatidyltransferase family protein [Candidatus Rokubacteria bacterium]